jgi:arylsulfatase A-like enzyme
MDGPLPASRVRSAGAALLLAAVVLGVADALIAIGRSVAIAPERTLPLCLTAPFPIALLVLAPVAMLAVVHGRWGGGHATVRSVLALLLGFVGALVALRAASSATLVVRSWAPGGGGVLIGSGALAVAGWLGFATARRLSAASLRRVSQTWLVWLVGMAVVVHAAAVNGVVVQWRREGRGLERDLVGLASGAGSGEVSRLATRAIAQRAATPLAPRPDHLVLITIDTLRADHLDDARMPRTAALAQQGARLTHAFASSSWTLPSVASLLTGLPAASHGAGEPLGPDPLSRAPLGTKQATLATALGRAGFANRAVVTNPYLGLGYGLGQGFDAYENVSLESEAAITLGPTVGFATLAWLMPGLAITDRGDGVTSRAVRFLRARHDGRFFLWLHYLDAHAPYDGVTRSFRDELLAGGGVTTRLPRMAQLRAGEVRPDAVGRVMLRKAYADAVRFVDQQVGQIVDALDEIGLADRTLLVVTADHGEELWDHGGVEHGHTLYDELIRVPLVMRCPGCGPRGIQIDAPVATAALAPTLLDLLGVDAGPGVDTAALRPAGGFAPLLRGEAWRAPPIVSENLLFAEERVAVRTARHTYVAWPNGKEEVYDRARDPHELHDLAARSALLARHRALLAEARGASQRELRATDPPRVAAAAASSGAATADSSLQSALRALGYVQ